MVYKSVGIFPTGIGKFPSTFIPAPSHSQVGALWSSHLHQQVHVWQGRCYFWRPTNNAEAMKLTGKIELIK